jgi:hypothetical protein
MKKNFFLNSGYINGSGNGNGKGKENQFFKPEQRRVAPNSEILKQFLRVPGIRN